MYIYLTYFCVLQVEGCAELSLYQAVWTLSSGQPKGGGHSHHVQGGTEVGGHLHHVQGGTEVGGHSHHVQGGAEAGGHSQKMDLPCPM